MTFFTLTRPGGPWDYPTLGFSAVNEAVLDGSASTPAVTSPPDAYWAVGGSAESGITRYANPVAAAGPAEPADGAALIYSNAENRFLPTEIPLADIYATPGDVVALVPGEVAEAVGGHTPGSEMGYIEKTNNFSTTNVSPSLALITGLTTVVNGAGRPVDVEAVLPRVSHSVADGGVIFGLWAVKTGSAGAWIQLMERRTPVTAANSGEPVIIKRRFTLGVGEEWTFGVYMAGMVAGTSSLYAASGSFPNPASLSVISR